MWWMTRCPSTTCSLSPPKLKEPCLLFKDGNVPHKPSIAPGRHLRPGTIGESTSLAEVQGSSSPPGKTSRSQGISENSAGARLMRLLRQKAWKQLNFCRLQQGATKLRRRLVRMSAPPGGALHLCLVDSPLAMRDSSSKELFGLLNLHLKGAPVDKLPCFAAASPGLECRRASPWQLTEVF